MLQNKDEISGDPASDPSEVIKNGSSPRFPFGAKPEDLNSAGAFEDAQERVEPKGCVPYKQDETPNNVTGMAFLTQLPFDNMQQFLYSSSLELLIVSVVNGICFYSCADNVASQKATQLTNLSPSDDLAGHNGTPNNPELAIDEGTISLSSQYSQGYVPSVYTNKTISFLSKVYQIICIFYVLCFRNAVSCICST